jgi:hypothetical protein
MKIQANTSSSAVGGVAPCAPNLEYRKTARGEPTRPACVILLLLGLILLHPSFCLRALGQSYSIDWYKIAGGGGTSTGGVFAVSGTIGQADAGGAMTGGQYSLTGGFWSLYAVQTPGAPLLTITFANNQAIVSWPASATGWMLQTNGNLGTTNWVNYGASVVNNSVTNSPTRGKLFFRLVNP